MLIMSVLNVGQSEITDEANVCDYKVEVFVTAREANTMKIISSGKIMGHRRSEGWRKLCERACRELPDREA